MSNLILPTVHPTKEELAAADLRRQRYEADPVLKQLADDIHHHRMMPPPACDQCIQMAIARLEKRK